eukprot:SAG25_NODE_58_length_18473_cov_99.552846_12_plen_319_part_00
MRCACSWGGGGCNAQNRDLVGRAGRTSVTSLLPAMPIRTALCEMLGIEHPIVMGGLTGAGTPELAAAVSNAGGCGFVCAHMAGSPERCVEWLQRMNDLTTKPWGVNLTILREFANAEGYCDAIIESGCKIIETAGRNPREFIPRLKAGIPGCIIIHKCTSIRHSKSAIRIGADIISLDGFECAGHPGEDDVGNFVLQAAGARKLSAPFICSGVRTMWLAASVRVRGRAVTVSGMAASCVCGTQGVTTGSQLAAALALGAEGVNIGTLFCCSQECIWPQSFKERVIEADETQTAITLRPLRNSSRIFRNRTADEVRQHG